ncbi:hypothetical protein COU74_05425 [Candidatus Peregrinibacteria bacterium CG10_big_fil_rev_8_21_14_0_10_36_19]|nr:MAG: hypothetical protein COU74_05425 [Candidatus Peregrinibacteria bacterium CG10_big_fil_rev_8_21_14_0_10_36_19]
MDSIDQQPVTSTADMLKGNYEAFDLITDSDGNLPASIDLAKTLIPQGVDIRVVNSIEKLPPQCIDEAFCDTGNSVWDRYHETIYKGRDGKIVRQTSTMKISLFDETEAQITYFIIQNPALEIVSTTATAVENV